MLRGLWGNSDLVRSIHVSIRVEQPLHICEAPFLGCTAQLFALSHLRGWKSAVDALVPESGDRRHVPYTNPQHLASASSARSMQAGHTTHVAEPLSSTAGQLRHGAHVWQVAVQFSHPAKGRRTEALARRHSIFPGAHTGHVCPSAYTSHIACRPRGILTESQEPGY